MTGTPQGTAVKLSARCEKFCEYVGANSGPVDARRVQELFEDPNGGISVGKATIDMMVFNTTDRDARGSVAGRAMASRGKVRVSSLALPSCSPPSD